MTRGLAIDRATAARLLVIGTGAGIFSGLFGVGGGTVIVPLLILWFGYGEKPATGTSLAAIIIIAALATFSHGLYGNVDLLLAAIIAPPAVLGVVAGTWFQQRLKPGVVSLIFAAFMVFVAVEMLLP